jgi:mycothiol synthase
VDSQVEEREARARLDALPGLTWQPIGREDLPAVADLYATCEAFDQNPERQSLRGLQEYWDSPRSRPDLDTLVGYAASGCAVAVAWAGCNRVVTQARRVHLGGAVHPDHRGQGIGRAVLGWELAHGRAWDETSRRPGYGPLVMRLYVPAEQRDVRDLAERHGLPTVRYFFEMSRALTELPPAADAPGVRLEGWDAARSPEVRRMVDEAFRDHWGHTDSTEQTWAEFVGSEAFRPEWTVLAVDDATGHVVGAALNCAYEQDWRATGLREGYTDQLGVAASHRGRGIASALLHASMRRFAASGMDAAGLGVDTANDTGALRLYERLGYRQTDRTCVHELAVEPS